MLLQIAALRLDRPVRINLVSLYWHFDIVWIGIFSVVYFQGALR